MKLRVKKLFACDYFDITHDEKYREIAKYDCSGFTAGPHPHGVPQEIIDMIELEKVDLTPEDRGWYFDVRRDEEDATFPMLDERHHYTLYKANGLPRVKFVRNPDDRADIKRDGFYLSAPRFVSIPNHLLPPENNEYFEIIETTTAEATDGRSV